MIPTLYPSLSTGINRTIEAARRLHRVRQPTNPHQSSTTDHSVPLTVLRRVVTSPVGAAALCSRTRRPHLAANTKGRQTPLRAFIHRHAPALESFGSSRSASAMPAAP